MQPLGWIRLNPKLKHGGGWSLSFKKNIKYDFVQPFIKKKYKVHTWYMNKACNIWGTA